MENGVAFYPLEVVRELIIIPFPYTMCGVNSISKGDLEVVSGHCEVVPEVEPLIPVLSHRYFMRKLE